MPISTIALAACLSLFADDPPASGSTTQPPSAPPSSPAGSLSGGGGFRPAQGPASSSGSSLPPSTPPVSPAGTSPSPSPSGTAGGGGFAPSSGPAATSPAATSPAAASPAAAPPVIGSPPITAGGNPAATSTNPPSSLPFRPAGSPPTNLGSPPNSPVTNQGGLAPPTGPPSSTAPPISIPQGARGPTAGEGAPATLGNTGTPTIQPLDNPQSAPPSLPTRSLANQPGGIGLGSPAPTTPNAAGGSVGQPFPGSAARTLDTRDQATGLPAARPAFPTGSGDIAPSRAAAPVTSQPPNGLPNASSVTSQPGFTPRTPDELHSSEEESPTSNLARAILESVGQQTDARRGASKPTPLLQAIAEVSDVERRKLIIKRYWGAAIANLDLTFALTEQRALDSLALPATRAQQTELTVARTLATARLKEAELMLKLAQLDLIEVMGRGSIEQAPWPTDTPFIGKYRTNYERYAAIRSLPTSIERIHHSLPLVLGVIESRAEAIAALETHWQSLASEYQSGRLSVADLLGGHRELRDQRLALLAAVRDYNQLICDYALTVAPQGLPAESVVPMLIKQPSSMIARDGSIRRASFEQPETLPRQSNLDSTWRSLTPR